MIYFNNTRYFRYFISMIPINPKNKLKYPKKQNVSDLNSQFVTDSYKLGGKLFSITVKGMSVVTVWFSKFI